MKKLKKTNAVIVNPNQQTVFVPRQDPYTMNMNQRRNCYNCGEFEHLAKNCKNLGIIEQGRRLKYGDNINTGSNLNREESLIILNQALVIIDLQCSVG